MQSSFPLFTVFGVRIGIHWSWLFIFFLLTWTFSSEIFLEEDTGWDPGQRWVAGTATAILFFGAVLVHELSHAFMARRLGMAVNSITLFIFGGSANMEGEMKSARAEFLVAIVGPLTSIALAGVFFVVYLAARDSSPFVDLGMGYLAFVNLALGVFNLVPGFPLDGGRVLRSIIWATNKNLVRATMMASRVGVLVAYLMIGTGVLMFFGGAWVAGIWWIFIGLFLRGASEASYAHVLTQRATSGLTAGDVAEGEFQPVDATTTLRELIDTQVLRHSLRVFPVMSGSELLGLVTLTDIRKYNADQWLNTTVYAAMTPATRLVRVEPTTPLEEVIDALRTNDINQVPVMKGRELTGFVSRAHVMKVIQLRAELAQI